jgi:hypothetical protein
MLLGATEKVCPQSHRMAFRGFHSLHFGHCTEWDYRKEKRQSLSPHVRARPPVFSCPIFLTTHQISSCRKRRHGRGGSDGDFGGLLAESEWRNHICAMKKARRP